MRSHTVSEERHPNPSADVEGSVHRPPQLVHAPFICDASAFQWVGAHQGVAPWQRRRTRRRNRTACKFGIAKRPNIGFGRLFFLLSQAIQRFIANTRLPCQSLYYAKRCAISSPDNNSTIAAARPPVTARNTSSLVV